VGSPIDDMYDVSIKRKVLKKLNKPPLWVQKKMALLTKDLRDLGPEQPRWQDYSKLSSIDIIAT